MRTSRNNANPTSESSRVTWVNSQGYKGKTWWYSIRRRSSQSPMTRSSCGITSTFSTTISNNTSAERTSRRFDSKYPNWKSSLLFRMFQPQTTQTPLRLLLRTLSAHKFSPGAWTMTSRIRPLRWTRITRSFGTSRESSLFSVRIRQRCPSKIAT